VVQPACITAGHDRVDDEGKATLATEVRPLVEYLLSHFNIWNYGR
jgi:hypothetical protein